MLATIICFSKLNYYEAVKAAQMLDQRRKIWKEWACLMGSEKRGCCEIDVELFRGIKADFQHFEYGIDKLTFIASIQKVGDFT